MPYEEVNPANSVEASDLGRDNPGPLTELRNPDKG